MTVTSYLQPPPYGGWLRPGDRFWGGWFLLLLAMRLTEAEAKRMEKVWGWLVLVIYSPDAQ
jgi:hypothetical protein